MSLDPSNGAKNAMFGLFFYQKPTYVTIGFHQPQGTGQNNTLFNNRSPNTLNFYKRMANKEHKGFNFQKNIHVA